MAYSITSDSTTKKVIWRKDRAASVEEVLKASHEEFPEVPIEKLVLDCSGKWLTLSVRGNETRI